jgi:hypothetical protein
VIDILSAKICGFSKESYIGKIGKKGKITSFF